MIYTLLYKDNSIERVENFEVVNEGLLISEENELISGKKRKRTRWISLDQISTITSNWEEVEDE